ncbi:hypothetical protein HanIR_Chr11g0534921 [Helianthus annuus]|nr:hypothetical protein HanIR_Chr11g0534921 [Helianthus annuus]
MILMMNSKNDDEDGEMMVDGDRWTEKMMGDRRLNDGDGGYGGENDDDRGKR